MSNKDDMTSSSSPPPPPPEHVVIAGAGMVGVSTAYYLATNYGIRTTLVDPTGTIAPAASGKAGGFLAKDWNDFSPTGQLTHRSFDLHQQLADTFGADSIQYRRLTCAAISVDPSAAPRPKGKKLEGVEWASNEDESSSSVATGIRSLGTTETIAQVHPKLLCEQLWKGACQKVDNCQLQKGRVVGAVHEGNRLVGAKLDNDSVVQADALLYACGPWTADILLGIKYHSAVVSTTNNRVLSQCVFFSGCGDPEVYVRPDRTAYLTGFPEGARQVTELPGQEEVLPEKIATILNSVRDATAATTNNGSSSSSGALELDQDPVVQQACYLPTTNDGIPVMGPLPDQMGCYIAAGHSCWGILLGPATGESMACLIATGKETDHVSLRAFSPARYRTIQPVPNLLNTE